MQSFSEIEDFLQTRQPELTAEIADEGVSISGNFIVYAQDIAEDQFSVRILIPAGFPMEEPTVWELGERIDRTPDMHMNGSEGACCLTVWEAWLASTENPSFQAFMDGPVADFFLGQAIVERGGDWPFNEFPHYRPGLIQAFAGVLGHVDSEDGVIAYLTILSRPQIKGHFICPCGSGKVLRKCHRTEVEEVATRIHPALATKMLRRLR